MKNILSLSKSESKEKIKISTQNPWDAAIAEAKRKISELRFSIKDFQRRKERGDKWLGLEKDNAGTH